jgi:hypothetical protein
MRRSLTPACLQKHLRFRINGMNPETPLGKGDRHIAGPAAEVKDL